MNYHHGTEDTFAGHEIVGLIPAGGRASRISPLPCSKELYPVGFHSTGASESLGPKVAAQYLLEKMKAAGIAKVFIVLREGKWDIPTYFGDGSTSGMHIGYLMLGAPLGVPFTLDQAHPFVQDAVVAFGFPDILFEASNPFGRLLEQQALSEADVSLGLCPATHPLSQEDRVEIDDNGAVERILLNPAESSLSYSWAIAVWKPSFTRFLHQYIESWKSAGWESEVSAGYAIQAGIQAGLRAEGVVVSETPYLDIGTPGGLRQAIRRAMEL